jgi:uncharacterized SAM-dependent methyltransferase
MSQLPGGLNGVVSLLNAPPNAPTVKSTKPSLPKQPSQVQRSRIQAAPHSSRSPKIAVAEPLRAEFSVRVLLTEQEIAADFCRALAARFLDEKFFYWLPLSVAAWVELASVAQQDYRNTSRALRLIETSAPEMPRQWPHVKSLCGIGCGEGSKDEFLLTAFRAAPAAAGLDYLAADFSHALVEMACARALRAAAACPDPAAAGQRVNGMKLDVMRDEHLRALAPAARGAGPCLFAVLGNTLGAFGPAKFPTRLRALVAPDDRVLFDGELFAGAETLRGYDTPVNRRFAFAPLASLGLEDGRDGDLIFELRPPRDGVHELAKFFVARRDLELDVAGYRFRLAAGERLLMSGSIKYERDTFLRMIELAGFAVEMLRESDDGRFLLAGARPT